MTDIPPDSPIDIRALVLYDIHQWKTTEKSHKNYEKLCEVMRKEAICYEEYEYLFNKFLEENYYSAKDGRGLLIPDIRGCILSDVINGKTAEKSIDDLFEAFKNHKIDKEDHDYWYKRFENGHLFSRVMFSDFPEDVFAEIVEKCDIKSYFNLRNVSFGLRTVIDQLAPPCTDIGVKCGDEWINVSVDDTVIANSFYFEKATSLLSLELFEKLSPKTVELLLRNPKLRLKSFEFFSYPYAGIGASPLNYRKHFFNLLNSLDHKIHVENCTIDVVYEKDVIKVLQCFKPGTLKELEIDAEFSKGTINKVVKMDQWKLAKHMKIRTFVLPSIENFFHFPSFELQGLAITMEDVVKLCENLPKSNAFEHCKVSIQEKWETIKRVLNLQPISTPRTYSIPNTNLCIQLLSNRFPLKSYKIYKI